MTTHVLPDPALTKGRFASLPAYSDEALFAAVGVRLAFTTREGGVSEGPYASLNLGSHVDDDPACVARNRRIVQEAFGCAGDPLIVPKQVHGDRIVEVVDAAGAACAQEQAAAGADALVVGAPHVAALLCYADCVPVIIVSPTGRFAVVHAGWRGVDNLIAVSSLRAIAQADAAAQGVDPAHIAAGCNVYLGPHIHPECFETGLDVHARFVAQFGEGCAHDATHIDLAWALRAQLADAGVDVARICDVDACTVCRNDEFFSYRGQGGTAGRHGAFAVRIP